MLRLMPQVAILRDYLGTALIHAYELRRLVTKKLIISGNASGGCTDGCITSSF
jgi:hypothetical protein